MLLIVLVYAVNSNSIKCMLLIVLVLVYVINSVSVVQAWEDGGTGFSHAHK